MRNTIYIKHYTTVQSGSRRVKFSLYEMVRRYFKGDRYITTIRQRCTSINKAAAMIENVGHRAIIHAEWIDGNGTSVDLVRNGRLLKKKFIVSKITKRILVKWLK